MNIGGQLIPQPAVQSLLRNIRSGKISNWDDVHAFYRQKSKTYETDKLEHAFASLLEIMKISPARFTKKIFQQLLVESVSTREWILEQIVESRSKDYTNSFRQMVYSNQKEMDNVTGKFSQNSFILQQREEMQKFRQNVKSISSWLVI
jgi:hypothetical protein